MNEKHKGSNWILIFKKGGDVQRKDIEFHWFHTNHYKSLHMIIKQKQQFIKVRTIHEELCWLMSFHRLLLGQVKTMNCHSSRVRAAPLSRIVCSSTGRLQSTYVFLIQEITRKGNETKRFAPRYVPFMLLMK